MGGLGDALALPDDVEEVRSEILGQKGAVECGKPGSAGHFG